MTHLQAHELAQQHGGTATQHVSRQTTMLVVGEEGWPLEPNGHPSLDMQEASRLQQEGLPLRIVSESDWLRLLGLDGRCREVHALYTPAMLSRSLNVPIGTIRRWERIGLIRPVKKVYRLPYFDYAEAAGVRRLNDLLQAGVPRSQLEASLAKIRHLLPGVERPLAQLNLLAQDARLVARDDRGLFEPTTGQRCFDFSAAAPDGTPLPSAADAAEAEDGIHFGISSHRDRQRDRHHRDDRLAGRRRCASTGRASSGSPRVADILMPIARRRRSRHFG